MRSLLYIFEINVICFIVLLFTFNYYNYKTIKHSTRERVFNHILLFSILLCFFDLCSELLNGKMFDLNHFILEITNSLFYLSMTMIGYKWFNYVYICIFKEDVQPKVKRFLQLPIFILLFLILTNHFNHFLFVIDSMNLYHRGIGIYIHWIISWFYIILATIMSLYMTIHAKSKFQREEVLPYFYFAIAPIIGSIIQMYYHSAASFQVGITISLLMIFFNYQNNMIQKDPLTGLKNRHVLERYFDRLITPYLSPLSIIMIDVNKFKRINDEYGHLVGDQALQTTATVLNNYFIQNHPSSELYRYGGDEFLIVHHSLDLQELKKIKQELTQEFQKLDVPYSLTVSIGYSCGNVYSEETIKKVLQEADKNMYKQKN